MRFAADVFWPGCGRSACRSGAKARSVPSSASTLIAAVTSAVRSSVARSSRASTSMPRMPSVPLMSASPSLAVSTSGAIPASRSAAAASTTSPPAVSTCPSPSSTSAQCASGARSPLAPERPVLRHDRREAGVEQREHGLGHLGPRAGAAQRQRAGAQEHHRPHDLALHGRRPCRRRASAPGRAAAPRGARAGWASWPASRSRWTRRRPAGRNVRAASRSRRWPSWWPVPLQRVWPVCRHVQPAPRPVERGHSGSTRRWSRAHQDSWTGRRPGCQILDPCLDWIQDPCS